MIKQLPGVRWRHALVAATAAVLLAACGGGGGDDDGNARVRLVNATADVGSIDLTVDGDQSDETRLFAAVARDAQSDFVNLAAGTYTVRGKRADASATLALNAHTLESDKHYTAYIYGRDGDYRAFAALEEQAEPAAGQALLRVFNTAPDAGALDVYLTDSDAPLDDAVPAVPNVAGATLSFYNRVDRGTWRLRVTGHDDPDDVRLDLPAFDLADKARLTLVLQPGSGGVLVHALVSQYQGALTAMKNTQARVRLAAGAANGGTVTARVGGVSLNVNLRSPSVGSYRLVPAGPFVPEVTVNNGDAVAGPPRTFVAGADHTLAVFGVADSPAWQLVEDRNQLPTSPDRARIRLLVMAPELDGEQPDRVALSRDFEEVTSDLFLLNPQIYTPVDTGTAQLEVSVPRFSDPLFAQSVSIAGRGVYTMFVMTKATGGPVGLLRKDR